MRKMFNKSLVKAKKGFTLVEIIVVLVIMGILLAIAVPSVMGYVNQANDQKYLAQARNGFTGAMTLNSKNITGTTGATAEAIDTALGGKITANNVKEEVGEASDFNVTAINCKVTSKKIEKCAITVVSGGTTKSAIFVTDGEAKIAEGTVVDGAGTGVMATK